MNVFLDAIAVTDVFGQPLDLTGTGQIGEQAP